EGRPVGRRKRCVVGRPGRGAVREPGSCRFDSVTEAFPHSTMKAKLWLRDAPEELERTATSTMRTVPLSAATKSCRHSHGIASGGERPTKSEVAAAAGA